MKIFKKIFKRNKKNILKNSKNVCVGYSSMNKITTGTCSTPIGYQAGKNGIPSGNCSIGIGYKSGKEIGKN
jgi:hypothetical protein